MADSTIIHVRGGNGLWSTVECPNGEVLDLRDTLRDLETNTLAYQLQIGGECPANPPPAEQPVLHREPVRPVVEEPVPEAEDAGQTPEGVDGEAGEAVASE